MKSLAPRSPHDPRRCILAAGARTVGATGDGMVAGCGMSVAIETATVYRGGGRRWFTVQAACRAEARAKLKLNCDCDYCDHPEMPGCPTEDLPCQYHDGSERAAKILRRMTRLYVAAWRARP